jgi:sugar/nucleoside kinase (ribokinase family)
MGDSLRLGGGAPHRGLVGVGGIGAGIFFALEGDHDLRRNESRPGRLLDVRDYCKLHIVAHYPAVLLGARGEGGPFHVLPVGKVGRDETGRRVRAEMESAGMDVRFVDAVPGHPTLFSVCFQYPDGSGGNVTTVDSAAALVSERDVDLALPWLSPTAIALAAPEVPLAVRRHLLLRAGEKGALRAASLTTAEILEARETGLLSLVDVLALNEDEAAALAGEPWPEGDPAAFLDRCADILRASQPTVRAVVTAGARGVFAFDGSAWTHVPRLPVPVVSTAGAGDALLGALLAGLAAGLPFAVPAGSRTSLVERPLASALDLGVLAAAFKVTSPHTIPPGVSLGTLVAFARGHGVSFAEGFERLLPVEMARECPHGH